VIFLRQERPGSTAREDRESAAIFLHQDDGRRGIEFVDI
jgi:hypothetical protein